MSMLDCGIAFFCFLPMPWVIAIGLAALLQSPVSEFFLKRLLFIQTIALFVAWTWVSVQGGRNPASSVDLGSWVSFKEYHFEIRLIWDDLSRAHSFLVLFLFSVILRFSFEYLHRDPGFLRFFFLLTVTLQGMLVISLAGNLDLLVAGWEWVGICSVSLIAFFGRTLRSAANSIRAMISYRICDASLLLGTIGFHHELGAYGFNDALHGAKGSLYGFLIVCGIFAKSAQLPFTNWIFRAVEGPTSSSAIFYGALSIHLGPFLLLRTWDMWAGHIELRLFLGCIASLTAVYATLVGRTRPDAKTGLAFASVTQVSLIILEVTLGFRTFALVHLMAHAVFRASQFLRSNSLLADFQDNSEYRNVVTLSGAGERGWGGPRVDHLRERLYVFSVDLFYLDQLQLRIVRSLESLSSYLRAPFSWLPEISVSSPVYWILFAIYLPILACGVIAWRVGWDVPIPRWGMDGILFGAVFLSIQSFTAKRAFESFFAVVGSQALVLVAGFFGNEDAFIGGVLLLGVMPVAQVYLLVFLRSWFRSGGSERLDGFQGAASLMRDESKYFILWVWIASGLPGSLAFVGEDLLFHGLHEKGVYLALVLVSVMCLNGIAYYRIYARIFLGPLDESVLPRPMHPGFRAALLTCLLAVFLGAWMLRGT